MFPDWSINFKILGLNIYRTRKIKGLRSLGTLEYEMLQGITSRYLTTTTSFILNILKQQ